MNKVYIIGGAQTDFGRNWSKEGKGVAALLKEVVDDCLDNTGFVYDDIVELNPAFYGVPSARYEAACASGSVALDAAVTKIKSGDYDVAIVIGWELMKTVDSKTGGNFLGRAALYEKETRGIVFPLPKLFGRLADETIIKYKLDEKRYMDNLATISEINYANAKRNPKAQTKKWFMSKAQASLRGSDTNAFVGGKIAISDCSQMTDGAAAVILVSEKYAKANYSRKNYPVVKGYGHRVAPMDFSKKIAENINSLFILPWTRQAVVEAYRRSNLKIKDIDFFETEDGFTPVEYVAISAFGLTPPGKEYEAIEDGRIAFDGICPINPSGGLIGCGHPVGASGVRMILDLYRQISGTAGTYQLARANNGMMLNVGGTVTTNYVFVIGRDC